MDALEKQFEAACDAGDIPGAILLAKDKSGAFTQAQAQAQAQALSYLRMRFTNSDEAVWITLTP